MEPLKMQPVLKETVWGGSRLRDLLGKDAPADKRIGESWELADHPHGTSTVAEGRLAGRTLREILAARPEGVLGRELVAAGWAERFGLLIKFIDATDVLSVQVHPDDAFAAKKEKGERGKTECWVIVDAAPDAWLVDGLAEGTTPAALKAAIKDGSVEELLVKRPVAAGDFVWIPAGTVHAIGAGLVLAEVQQTSDVTYRLHDWGRKGLDGKPRPLHVEKGVAAASYEAEKPLSGGRGKTADETGLVIEHLVDCHAFSLSRIQIDRRPWAAETGGTCAALVVLDGRARCVTGSGECALEKGDTVLVPADAEEYAFDSPENLTVLVAAGPGRAPTR